MYEVALLNLTMKAVLKREDEDLVYIQDTPTWLVQIKWAARLYQDIRKHKMKITEHMVKSELKYSFYFLFLA